MKAQSSSHPFTPLSELVLKSPSRNQPVITVSLLAKPPPPPSVTTDDGAAPAQNGLDVSHSTVNMNSRSKSRQQGPKEGKRSEAIRSACLVFIYILC